MKGVNMHCRGMVLMLISIVFVVNCDGAQTQLKSPDNQTQIVISEGEGHIRYSIAVNGVPLVSPSILGLEIGEPGGSNTWRIGGHKTRSVDEVWIPVWGKRSRIRNHFNELDMVLESDRPKSVTMRVVFRAYNDGVAFRYHIGSPETGTHKVVIRKELTEINFADDLEWWSYQRERAPKGPTASSEIDGTVDYPLLSESPSTGSIAVMEACLRNFPWAVFTSKKGETGFSLSSQNSVTVSLPFESPWRVLMNGESPGALIDSDLIVNLNPKAENEDYTWVKPGMSFWDWRAWGYKAADGFEYKLDLASWKRFIDFAAEAGIPYLLLDANWYGPEFSKDSHPLSGGKSRDVKEAIEYGKKKGIGLILYLNHVAAKKYGIEKILKAYAEWGAKGVKYGFMKIKSPIEKVRWTHKVVALCAKNRLLVNFHDGPVPPTGEEAFFPNFVHREFCHAQSDAKRTFSPSGFIKMVHVNMLAGPLDMNNGMFDLVNSKEQRPKVFKQVNSTILAEAARTLITYGGGVTVLPDAADSYRIHQELFRFISRQKLPWTESKTLDSRIGKYISMLRRTGDTYLIASVTDESSRDMVIDMAFLSPNQIYKATIFSDKPETHYLKNRMAYAISRRQVTSKDKIKVHIAPGSGHCMIIEPE